MTTSEKKDHDQTPLFDESSENIRQDIYSIRQKQRPGPPGADTLIPPNQDLEDASLILKLVESGKRETKIPPRDTSRDYIHLSGKERLSQEDETALALRVQRYSDIDARNCLVMSNIGLVHL